MADTSYLVATGVSKKLKDMGDGTHAEVVALAATPSIDIGDVQLLAGTAVVGKVGIDQTTPGTTDSVTVSAAQGAGAAIGTTAGVAVITDANGTIQQYLRGIVKLLITAGTVVLGAGSALIGKIGIDQTTPGTTNKVSLGSDVVSVSQGAAATGGYSFLNIAAGQATTIVKASAGTLHSITLNSAATATNTTVIYDHPSGVGTVIGRPNVVAATVPTTLIFDLAFANGLTIITAAANGGDMTVCYK